MASAREAKGKAGAAASRPDRNLVTVDAHQAEQMKLVPVGTHAFQIEKSAPGRIAFDEDQATPVFTPYTGRITRLLVRPGERVQRSTPLFEIDTPDLVQAESDLISAYTALQKAKNQLELSQRIWARQKDLWEAKAIAEKDWEQAESDLRNAQADLRAAEGLHHATRDHLRVFGKSDAEITRIESERRIDRLTTVVAPIGGVVTARKVGPGQYVKPDNPDPLFTIADLSMMWFIANVAETDIPLVRIGQSVEVRVDAFPSDLFRARVTYIAPAADPATHRVAVRAEVGNRGGKLKPEMFASFRIMTDAQAQSAAVPLSAIIREGSAATVWVAAGPQRFSRRTITIGLEQEGMAQVLSGVTRGEQVVSEGGVFLTNFADGRG
jgi:membrane fusion protein, heavy metal efflux system